MYYRYFDLLSVMEEGSICVAIPHGSLTDNVLQAMSRFLTECDGSKKPSTTADCNRATISPFPPIVCDTQMAYASFLETFNRHETDIYANDIPTSSHSPVKVDSGGKRSRTMVQATGHDDHDNSASGIVTAPSVSTNEFSRPRYQARTPVAAPSTMTGFYFGQEVACLHQVSSHVHAHAHAHVRAVRESLECEQRFNVGSEQS